MQISLAYHWGFPGVILTGASQVAQVVKSLPANTGDIRDVGSIPRSERSPPILLPGESHVQRSLGGCSP